MSNPKTPHRGNNKSTQEKVDEIQARIAAIANRGPLEWSEEAGKDVDQIHALVLHLEELLEDYMPDPSQGT